MTTDNSNQKSLSDLKAIFGDKLEYNKELSQFTGYKTGGPAKLFINAETDREISDAVKTAQKYNIPLFLIGGGTNVLISDKGFDGLIVKISIKGMTQNETAIECGAGEELRDLLAFAADNSLTGLEFATEIVGSVGGAIYGNAGAYGGEIGTVCTAMTLIDQMGDIKRVKVTPDMFGYRDSILKKSGEIVISAEFMLQKGEKTDILRKMEEISTIRHEKLPYDECSAGCYFKNIPDESQPHGKLAAGKLLEEIGAKKMSHGGAMVSEKHANIIVNSGSATSKEIYELADKLKEKVFEKFGIMLEEEVIRIGEF